MPASRKPAYAGHERSIPHFREAHEMRPREASGWRSEPRSGARVGVFVRRFRRLSCHGACREPQVGMAGDVRRRSSENRMSNEWLEISHSTFKSKRRRDIPAAERRSASRRGSWFAPVGAASAANTHIRQYMRKTQILAIYRVLAKIACCPRLCFRTPSVAFMTTVDLV